jgi:hypothetical protein
MAWRFLAPVGGGVMEYGEFINYRPEVRRPHYSIQVQRHGELFVTNGRVYPYRDDALNDLRAMKKDGPSYAIWFLHEYESVFYAWCALCGKIGPDWPYCAYPDWDSARDAVLDVPGWSATSEQLIFCTEEPREAVARWL